MIIILIKFHAILKYQSENGDSPFFSPKNIEILSRIWNEKENKLESTLILVMAIICSFKTYRSLLWDSVNKVDNFTGILDSLSL